MTRHSGASAVTIHVASEGTSLELSIRDDGAGGADVRRGTGLIGLKDRVEALGGRMGIESPPGRGTSLAVTLPLPDADAAGLDA